ncbi:hypothetical protein DFJ43DRAFT_65366 [Lentinula guzmanii]|uniref:Uncharacterized protein n=1 Tax=Lentinula guzmanii TaxID=2804957 RepID=A0AA38JQ06_9AGAR|nr:hypothetical protein DFJ43DRAFT_65366 [Lentinula guzmanii]
MAAALTSRRKRVFLCAQSILVIRYLLGLPHSSHCLAETSTCMSFVSTRRQLWGPCAFDLVLVACRSVGWRCNAAHCVRLPISFSYLACSSIASMRLFLCPTLTASHLFFVVQLLKYFARAFGGPSELQRLNQRLSVLKPVASSSLFPLLAGHYRYSSSSSWAQSHTS